jgi:L-iditol 2-dehydrogenase
MAIKAVAGGSIDPERIVTAQFDFDDLQRAMDESINNKAEIVKSVIKIAK